MTTVVIWDIDGTLVRTKGGRVSLSAFLRALQRVSNLPDAPPFPTDPGGKTDDQIALELLLAASITEATAISLLPAFREAYLAELERAQVELVADLRVLPGVREALARLRDTGITQSLLTGNLEPIARLKLACVDLDGYVDFDIGAYGSDHRDRNCLVPITRQRLRDRLGMDVEAQDIVVIGDTPRDVACARAGGARVIAVATGSHRRAELEQHLPDAVLDDLSDTDAVVATLLGIAATVQ